MKNIPVTPRMDLRMKLVCYILAYVEICLSKNLKPDPTYREIGREVNKLLYLF